MKVKFEYKIYWRTVIKKALVVGSAAFLAGFLMGVHEKANPVVMEDEFDFDELKKSFEDLSKDEA